MVHEARVFGDEVRSSRTRGGKEGCWIIQGTTGSCETNAGYYQPKRTQGAGKDDKVWDQRMLSPPSFFSLLSFFSATTYLFLYVPRQSLPLTCIRTHSP
ncbi:hypothetical protein EJ02DRAFT_2465 [Clathrospora elynae]|uniref:Uncharacterized protein n=1 Tax=Clathrospora elynae TaxID=706981 RepID=A0A6A5T683_9PLEO|nr:hypothetical protein EJ02DRAFT_2465 [Clathrospora elynae]